MSRVAEKRWLIVVVMLGLVAGLLGVGGDRPADAAHGEDPDVDFEATYSACVGAAAEPAGFEDTAGSFAEDAINCLSHYGITQGRTATTFAPNETVLRWQMALFLARAAGPAGIVLENPATDQGFTDVGAVSDSARNAINGLAAAGIMPGATATTFRPNQSVTRASMAMLLDSFLREARPGTGAYGPDADQYSEVVSDNNAVFNDISGVSIVQFNAIGRIYELGVTTGVGDHQFGPNGIVTRAQMAAFITRALAHTAARPAGVSVQTSQDSVKGAGSSTDLLISVRDTAFEPLSDTAVDVFSSGDAIAAFASDGSCASGKVTAVIGAFACQVDANDEVTDVGGDITDLTLDGISSATTVWAWTGDVNEKYGEETVSSSATVGFIKAPVKVLLTDDMKAGQERLRLGETVKFTLQVADEDDNPSPEAGWRIPITIRETNVNAAVTGGSNTRLTDAQGRIELSFTKTGTTAAGERAKVTIQFGGSGTADDAAVMPGVSGSLPVVDKTTNGVETVGADAGKYVANWSEASAVPTTLTLTPGNDFTLATDSGRGGSNVVTATLTDQYGSGIQGARVAFRSDDQDGIGAADDGLDVTVNQNVPQPGTHRDGIVLEVNPRQLIVGSSLTIEEIALTVSAYRTSGQAATDHDLPIHFGITLPYGVTADPVSLRGQVTIPRHSVSGSQIHYLREVVVQARVLDGGTMMMVPGPLEAGCGADFTESPTGVFEGTFSTDFRPCHLVFQKVGDLPTGPDIGSTVYDYRMPMVSGEPGEQDNPSGVLVSQEGLIRYVPCQFTRLQGSAALDGGVTPVRCLTGEPRNNNYRTTNRSGKAVFAYSRDEAAGGLETIWASYLLGQDSYGPISLLTDRLYHPWAVETEGNVSGRILAADPDNDQAVILTGPDALPQLVRYDRNDQLGGLEGLDVYANFDQHLRRTEDAVLPGYMTVGPYSDTAGGVSRIYLHGLSAYQPSAAIAGEMGDTVAIDASGNGVVVIGTPDDNRAYVFSGPGDREPQVLTLNSRTVYETILQETEVLREARRTLPGAEPMDGDAVYRKTVRSEGDSSFGTDVAISDDGNTIVIGDPERQHWDLRVGRHIDQGAAYVYTRGAGGQYQLAATLTNDFYLSSANPYYTRTAGADLSLSFGAGVDISGDGNTIAVASPGGGFISEIATPLRTTCLSVWYQCETGYIQVYTKSPGGWQNDDGSNWSSSYKLLPRVPNSPDFACLEIRADTTTRDVDNRICDSIYDSWEFSNPSTQVGMHGSVSVSYDGSVVAAGDNWASLSYPYPDEDGDVVCGVTYDADYDPASDGYMTGCEEAGAVFVWERPADGWSTGRTGNSYNGLLALTAEEVEEFDWLGAGVRLSADGSAVVLSQNHPQAGEREAKLNVFTKPVSGWVNSTTYQTLAPSALPSGEVFGQWVDISWDGSEIFTNRHLQPLGDYRGGVQAFSRSSDGTWEASGQFLGDAGSGFGRFVAVGGDDSIVAADQFGGKVTWISRPR